MKAYYHGWDCTILEFGIDDWVRIQYTLPSIFSWKHRDEVITKWEQMDRIIVEVTE